MNKAENGLKLTIAEILNFVGGVSGMLALLAIVFYGGAAVEKLKNVDARVQTLEINGSMGLKQHVASDEQIQGSHEKRLSLLENLLTVVHRTESKVEGLSVKIDSLKDQQTQHEQQKNGKP